MLDKIKDIEEMGNKLLSSNRLSSLYEDKFTINNVEFKFKEEYTSSYLAGQKVYVFDVILYTDIPLVLPTGLTSSYDDYQKIDSQLWDYDLDPLYLSDVIIPKQILSMIMSILPIATELTILGDKGQFIWDGPNWNKRGTKLNT